MPMRQLLPYNIPANPRALFAAGALCCFTASLVSLPNPGDTQNARPELRATRPQSTSGDAAVQPIEPLRDAFAPAVVLPEDQVVPAGPSHATLARAGTLAASTLRVTAIADGDHAGAILESPDGVRAVAVGDAIDGTIVSTIGPGVVVLADGRKLYLGGRPY